MATELLKAGEQGEKQVRPPEVVQEPWQYNFKGGGLRERKEKGFISFETKTKIELRK